MEGNSRPGGTGPAEGESQRPPNGPSAKEAMARRRMSPREAVKAAGPGIITGGAGKDPAGVTTYAIVGAQHGYALNWLLLLSTPLLIAVMNMSARVGNVTKTDLATVIQNRYGRRVALPAVLITIIGNLLVIGADLLAITGVLGRLTGIDFIHFVVPVTLLMAYVLIFLALRGLAGGNAHVRGGFRARVPAPDLRLGGIEHRYLSVPEGAARRRREWHPWSTVVRCRSYW